MEAILYDVTEDEFEESDERKNSLKEIREQLAEITYLMNYQSNTIERLYRIIRNLIIGVIITMIAGFMLYNFGTNFSWAWFSSIGPKEWIVIFPIGIMIFAIGQIRREYLKHKAKNTPNRD